MSEGGIDAGEAGGGEPPRRLSDGRCGRSRRQSCAARCRRRRRWCPHRCGHQYTARCGAKCGGAPQERTHECSERCGGSCASRCAAKPAPGDVRGAPGRAEAMPAAGAAGQGERGERCDERSELPGKRSAQRPKGAEARGIPARRVETAQRARQGSPVAKRRAQTHRRVTRNRIHHRHHRLHHRLHLRRQHPRHGHHQHRRHQHRHLRYQHRRYHRHRQGHQNAASIVAKNADTLKVNAVDYDAGTNTDAGTMMHEVKTCARPLVNRRVREPVQRKSGGAAAERGVAGDARSEGERRRRRW